MTRQDTQPDEFLKKYQTTIFPPDWKNPKPSSTYDLVVIGGGPGGMTAASVARSLNAKVALIEKAHMGGECFSYGCIPSKAFLSASRRVADLREAAEFGIELANAFKIDFEKVILRVHRLQAALSPHDSPKNFQDLGIDIFLGQGRFQSNDKIEVNGTVINFKKAVIVTGTEPRPLNVPGIDENDYFTNETIFLLKKLPKRLAVFGGGPIGCELSQAFHRFGSDVTIISTNPRIIPRDDALATETLRAVFEKEGIKMKCGAKIERIEKKGAEKHIFLSGQAQPIIVDEILVAVGRIPVTAGLDLEKANIKYDEKKGIITNSLLQTSNPNIYAAGDVTSPYKFTHISSELSTWAVKNALQNKGLKTDDLIVPWCTFTDPEVARVGMDETEAEAKGIKFEKAIVELKSVERAVLDGETVGFVKLLVEEKSDKILGATIMTRHAGDMIAEIGVAMQSPKGLLQLAQAIHPFPSQGQILRAAAAAIVKNRK